MSVWYIIDGCNLIERQSRVFDCSRRQALHYLSNLIVYEKPEGSLRNKLTVIIDGQPGISGPGYQADIRFTSGRTADEEIVETVKNSENPSRIIVVTDDKPLRRSVRKKGARFKSTSDFTKKLFKKKSIPVKNSKDKKISDQEAEKINKELRKKWLRKKE